MSSSNLNLLIVDDDKDLLRQLEFLLEDDFKEVLTASSRNEALELAAQPVDVFLIDVRLSDSDSNDAEGLELAKKIRKKNNQAVIVMMSRYDARKYEALSRDQAHADAFIRKPFTMEEFIELVSKIAEKNNKKFLQGGAGGAVFSKSAPPARRRQEKC
jgi:two-component system OmpR family response regulator